MDFTGVTGYSVTQETNEETGITTITLMSDALVPVLVGTLVVESYKVKAVVDSLAEIAKTFTSVASNATWTRRSLIDKNAKTATVKMGAPV